MSESTLFGTRQRLHIFPTVRPQQPSQAQLFMSDSIKILGVTLDNHLTITAHKQFLCRNILFHTRVLRHMIRPALTDFMAATVAASLSSRVLITPTHSSTALRLPIFINYSVYRTPCLVLFCLITQAQPAADSHTLTGSRYAGVFSTKLPS